MDEQREESEFVGDFGEPMEESGKGLGLSSKTEALDGEDATTAEVSDSCVCDVSAADGNPNDGGCSANEDGNTDNSVSDEKYVKADVGSVEDTVKEGGAFETEDNVERTDEPEIERNDMECEGDAGEEETVTSAGNEVADEKPNGGASDAEQDVQTEKSQQSSIDGETLSVAEDEADQKEESTKKSKEDNDKMGANSEQEKEVKVGVSYNEQRNSGCEASNADQEKESVKKSGEDNNKMDVDSEENEQGNPGDETTDAKHSESAQVPEEEPAQLSKGETDEEICLEEEITNVNQKGENGEAMEIDYAGEEQVEKDVKVGCTLDNTGNESAGAIVVQTQDIRIAEADGNDSNVVKEMEIDERKDNVDMASDLTETIESADSANPHSPSEDAATGEVEPLDHNALFDPSSDITNFIDFSGVSSWSGNIKDPKTETNVSLKEDKKAIDLADEIATVDCKETLISVDATVNAESHDNLRSAEGIQNESSEACVAFGAESPATATEYRREASDAIMGSDENQEEKGHECLDKKAVDNQAAMREEDDSTHEAPSIEPSQKEDTEMEENPNNSDYADDADDGTDSDIKTNGVKRKADVLSEDSPGEGRKTVSFAKVNFAQRPAFKIGACIARAASQMAGSPSVLKGGNFGDETLSVESFVSQLHCAATDPDKENVVSEIAAGFFLDFRNSSASQQVTTEKVGSKRGRPPNSTAGGTEAFEFEEMGDTYWTDRVIHNGGEEQTPSTEKGNYQVVPVELKPAQVQRTRRPYRRRQSQISIPLPSASDKPANFDENAPAELIMNFSETDTIPPEKSLSKMFGYFGPIRESQTEVDQDNNRARVVYRKSTDAEVAYNSAARFSIFGTKAVNYELSYTITDAFKVHPYVVSLGEEDAAHCPPS